MRSMRAARDRRSSTPRTRSPWRLFSTGQIGFLEIAAIVEDTLSAYDPAAPGTLGDVLAVDTEAREHAQRQIAVRNGAFLKDTVA